MISRISVPLKQGGFSQNTCFPARRAAMVRGRFSQFGVQTKTASRLGSAMISSAEAA